MRAELIMTSVWIYRKGRIFYFSRVISINFLNFREGKERKTALNAYNVPKKITPF